MKRYNVWVVVEEYIQTEKDEKYKDIHAVKIGQYRGKIKAIGIANDFENIR